MIAKKMDIWHRFRDKCGPATKSARLIKKGKSIVGVTAMQPTTNNITAMTIGGLKTISKNTETKPNQIDPMNKKSRLVICSFSDIDMVRNIISGLHAIDSPHI
jgi:hypothetical protein